MEFRILGALEIAHANRTIPLGGSRRRALLAALLLRANEAVSVGYLAEAIWERIPASACSNLRTHIAGLRHALTPAGARLVTEPSGYRLSVGDGELDLLRFEEAAARGAELMGRGEIDAAADHIHAALRIWRGTPSKGCRSGRCCRRRWPGWRSGGSGSSNSGSPYGARAAPITTPSANCAASWQSILSGRACGRT
nr:hypothetical protein GCM10020093_116390 [Planobispora longispora]